MENGNEDLPTMTLADEAVIAAVDGTSADAGVLAYAADEAVREEAALLIVSVVDPKSQLGVASELLAAAPEMIKDLNDAADRVLQRAAKVVTAAHPELSIRTSAPIGAPARTLIEASEHARCVVVGRARKSAVQRAVLGTVSSVVVHHARCPVIVVPVGATPESARRVVVGVDGSEQSRRAVAFALATAQRSSGSVTCVTAWNLEVVDGIVVTEPDSPKWANVEQRHTNTVTRILGDLPMRYSDVEITIDVRHGNAAVELLAADPDADLVVVGSRGRGGFRGLLLGSVTSRVLELAAIPVAVVR